MMKTITAFLILLVSFYSNSSDVVTFVKSSCKTNDVDTLLVVKIITHESKTYFNGEPQPWPWALNINGKGYYYKTYNAAVDAAEAAYKNNSSKLGLGLGQIEWRFHKSRFKNIAQALIPSVNIKKVCEILDEGRALGITNHFELAAYYHRPKRDQIAFKYASKVFE